MSAQLHSWTPDRLPDLTGKIYLVTGGNAEIAKHARDEKTARRLWEMSEMLVGFKWPVPEADEVRSKACA